MKKIFILTAFVAAMFAFSACSEEDYDSKYKDPSKVSDVSLDKLLPGTLLKSNNWAMSTYGRYFGYEPQLMAKMANTVGFTLDNGIYYHDEYEDYGQPYNDYPAMVTNYKKMEQVYEELPDEEKAANKAYLLAAETQLLGMMQFIICEYNDIPYSEIGQVALTGDISYSNPHYEDGQTLYEMILDRLGEIATEFGTVAKPSAMSGQDYINKGDLKKWQMYANSLRLRAALRVSTQGPLASKGQAILKEILDGNYPIVDDIDDNIQIARQTSGPLNVSGGGGGFDWHNLQTANTYMIEAMQKAGDGGVWVAGQDDPRLPLMYCMATLNGEMPCDDPSEEVVGNPLKTGKAMPTVFRGSSSKTDYDTYQTMFFTRVNRGYYSRARRYGFFWGNQNWDHQIISSYEIWFIKAEAYLRGWATGDAEAAFKKGISESIKLYFKYQNNRSITEASNGDSDYLNGDQQRVVINPDQNVYNDAWIDNFGAARWNTHITGEAYKNDTQFGGHLEAIMEQKWIAFGYLNSGESWGDLRRTGLPRMYYAKDHDDTAVTPYPCNRLRYVSGERTYNQNFADEVGSQDNYSDVQWWAIANWHDGPTY